MNKRICLDTGCQGKPKNPLLKKLRNNTDKDYFNSAQPDEKKPERLLNSYGQITIKKFDSDNNDITNKNYLYSSEVNKRRKLTDVYYSEHDQGYARRLGVDVSDFSASTKKMKQS